jgi:hypothetical protein
VDDVAGILKRHAHRAANDALVIYDEHMDGARLR